MTPSAPPPPRLKRTTDVVVAGTAIIALSPLMLLLAILVRLLLGSPFLFRQTRPGKDGRPFVLFKFRTMRDAADAAGRPLPDSERLTRFGRFLRSTSLDELPELWNVLRGDMSLVGPRPLLMEYLPLYDEVQRRRHEVLPGLTGWAQVHGRNALSWKEKFELDVWYVDHASFRLDLKILARTLRYVVRREGIGHRGSETMPRFRGGSQEARGLGSGGEAS